MREKNRNSIGIEKMLPQFTTMNVIDGQAGLMSYSSLIFYSLTIDNILNIIVLLILAGISISMLTGQNGILNRAQEAKNKTEQAEKEEKEKLGDMEDILNEYTTGISVEQVTDQNLGLLEGSGTDTDPYVINSIEDLVVFASNVTNGNTYEGQTVKLGLSLDFNSNKSYVEPLRTDYAEYGYDGELKTLLTSGEGFKPIGTINDSNISEFYFKGIFDGDYKNIYNLYQNLNNSNVTAIYGFFSTNGGIIKNTNLINCVLNSMTNDMHVLHGGIAGRNNSTIMECSVQGTIRHESNGSNGSFIGGIVGQNLLKDSKIQKCSSKVDSLITSNDLTAQTLYLAGIAGNNYGYIENSYNCGKLNVNCDNINNLLIAGIANDGSISNCYNMGNIYKRTIKESFSEQQVLQISGIGGNTKNTSNYNLGDISVDSNNGGYIAGISTKVRNNVVFENCYNLGKIKTSNDNILIGGLTGWTENQEIINSKWLKGSSENGIAYKGNNVIDGSIGVDNEEEMPNILTIIGSEFKEDINNINNGYPILNWQ